MRENKYPTPEVQWIWEVSGFLRNDDKYSEEFEAAFDKFKEQLQKIKKHLIEMVKTYPKSIPIVYFHVSYSGGRLQVTVEI